MYRYLIILSLLFVMFGCAREVELDKMADYYEEEGDVLMAQGKYGKAAQWYEQALVRAESPEYAAKIQLSLADSYFLAGKYEDAIPVYEVYLDVYRDLDTARLATVRVGLAYFNLVKYASRDQTYTKRSLEYLEQVRDRYPELVEEYQVDVRIYLLRERLARKEMLIAKYYARILKPEPEMLRYKYIIANYPDTIYYGEAVNRLTKLLLKTGKHNEALYYINQLKEIEPDSKYIKTCQKRYDNYMKKAEKLAAKEAEKKKELEEKNKKDNK